MTEKEQRKIDGILAAHIRRFHDRLSQSPYPAPSLFQLMIFSWFESDYFYPAPLNVFKKAVGNFFDYTTSRSATR
jgi:hypothetical protein